MGSTNEPGDHSETSPETAERGVFPYRTAASFRAALKDRLTAIANGDDRYTVNELQRQFAYDRALARLFTAEDAERWVLKGAGALLARLERARHRRKPKVHGFTSRLDLAPRRMPVSISTWWSGPR